MSAISYQRSLQQLPSDQVINQNLYSKNYLEVRVVQLLDNNNPVHDAIWNQIITHHCFRGNDTRMPLFEFYGDDPEDFDREDELVVAFVMDYIKSQGVDYTKYDDIMLCITW